MEKDNVKAKYIELVNKAKYFADMYYNKNISLISDQEYDKLLEEIENMEKTYHGLRDESSPTRNIGFEVNSPLAKVKHTVPMMSLSNTYNKEDLLKFLINTNVACFSEPKLDGLSLAIRYKNGIMAKALTRGDGNVGEDVTHIVSRMESVPKRITYMGDLEVRGECIITFKEFFRINEEREALGLDRFKNPRNLASGTLRTLDANITKERELLFVAFDLINFNGHIMNQESLLHLLQNFGFKTTLEYGAMPITINNVDMVIKNYQQLIEENVIPMDGFVVKVSLIDNRPQFGYTSKYPKWATAYKYEAESYYTKLLDVMPEIGRTGRITPVAKFEPVVLSGTNVEYASLHNYDYIVSKDIRIGDYIKVYKSAEIIPYVDSPDKDRRDGTEVSVLVPPKCPCCGGVVKPDGDKNIKCINEACPDVIKANLLYFASRDAMDIDGLGDVIISKLVDAGYVKTPVDLFHLGDKFDEITDKLGLSKKVMTKVVDEIEESKNNSFYKVLIGLGIPFVGVATAKLLSKAFNSIKSLMSADTEELQNVPGVGEKSAEAITKYFEKDIVKNVIDGLSEAGINMESKETTGKFNGMNIAISGGLKTLNRLKLADDIFDDGGNLTNQVTRNTHIMIVGEKPSLSKVDKARKMGIKTYTEDEFINKYM